MLDHTDDERAAPPSSSTRSAFDAFQRSPPASSRRPSPAASSDAPGTCVHDVVHTRALETPGAVAVVAGDRTLTYAQLDGRANALAAELRWRGVGPDGVVGIVAKRGPEMIVAALAVLKAGGAYLPLDASYPADRLAYIVEDARCTLLLCTPGAGEALPAAIREQAMSIELDGPTGEEPPPGGVTLDGLAYVIYTSGSTGRPKGVEITHRSLLNLVTWHRGAFGIGPKDRATQLAAVGFDAAVWEIWPYLATGASLLVPEEGVRTDPEALHRWLLKNDVTVAFVPTPMAARLLTLHWPDDTPLRTMLTGGDVLHNAPPPHLPFVLVNAYGPTECTVVATAGPVEPYAQLDRRPAIGRPIDGTEIHILDERRRPVPAGAQGEIYVGGTGVARGYRNQAELTADRFVSVCIDGRASQRLYRTGDLGRFLPDGQLAFVGRADDQIKVHGFRIEPNEIVTALDMHPGVVASAVAASDLGAGDKRLVGYVVLADGATPTPSDLQGTLRARLPDYMVPGVFVRLDALPLGPNGKIDRSQLPEPSPANTLRDGGFEAPRSLVEERVADLVRELWKLDDVSVHDNLFLLGGHSLIATQLIGRLRQSFGVDLALRTVFAAPSIAELSSEVERHLLAKIDAMTEDEARGLLSSGLPVTDAAQ